ncbi:MAG: hypothetical protein ACTSVI_05270 [Promethearchaeota archaeon]
MTKERKNDKKKEPFNILKTIEDLIDLFKENFKLRNIFELSMEFYMSLLPKPYFEKGMMLGKKMLDEIIYSIEFLPD